MSILRRYATFSSVSGLRKTIITPSFEQVFLVSNRFDRKVPDTVRSVDRSDTDPLSYLMYDECKSEVLKKFAMTEQLKVRVKSNSVERIKLRLEEEAWVNGRGGVLGRLVDELEDEAEKEVRESVRKSLNLVQSGEGEADQDADPNFRGVMKVNKQLVELEKKRKEILKRKAELLKALKDKKKIKSFDSQEFEDLDSDTKYLDSSENGDLSKFAKKMFPGAQGPNRQL